PDDRILCEVTQLDRGLLVDLLRFWFGDDVVRHRSVLTILGRLASQRRIFVSSGCTSAASSRQICGGGVVDKWQALPYAEWRDTLDTLHMYTQVVGKLRLALSPFEPQWANVPLYLTARGLTTSPVPHGLRTFDTEFDLIGHELVLRTS